ncbi:MAG: phosphoribosyltransferase family protein [Bacteroidia bacterium]
MKLININTQYNIKTFLFPDNQPHIMVENIEEGDEVKVVCSLTDANTLLQLLQCANALDHLFAKKKALYIPYLMGARFDRVMQSGDSFDLQVIAKMINSCGFEKVILYDVHSDVATALIRNSVNVSNRFLVETYTQKDAVLICPDAGAAKKIKHYFDWNANIVDVVYCIKSRDLSNGKITLKVLEPEKCEGRNCVIIDDICDGGGTFLAIANQIKAAHLTLIVTHGIFSKGVEILQQKINQIITPNSTPPDPSKGGESQQDDKAHDNFLKIIEIRY